MRKLLSILLLATIGLPFFAPLLALGQSAEAGLPACCRRNGAHHCAMNTMGATDAMRMAERSQTVAGDRKTPHWQAPFERCPYCPASVATWHHRETFAAPPAQAIFAEILSHPAGTVQTESKRRVARDRSRQKRGPPSLLG